MSITSISDRTFTVYRRTAQALDPARASLSGILTLLAKCPVHQAYLEVSVRGPVTLGTVDIVGELGGDPVIETLNFDAGTSFKLRTTCSQLDCVTSVVAAGFDPSGTIEARWVESGGESVHVNCVIAECVYGYKEARGGAGKWQATGSGGMSKQASWIAFDDIYDFTPQNGDIFVDDGDGQRWEVEGIPEHLGYLRPVHYELDVKLANNQDITIRTP